MTRVKVDVGRTSGNRSEQAAWSAERSALGKRLCGTPVIYHLRIYRVMRERERRRSRRNLTACCSRAAPERPPLWPSFRPRNCISFLEL